MSTPTQWVIEITIDAPVARVWEAIEDLSLIPQFHPVVQKVEFPTGETRRAPGVEYKCIIPEGKQKGWCVERVVEHVPMRKTTVAFTDDSWGMSRMFDDFLAETSLEPHGECATQVKLTARYRPRGFSMRLMHAIFIRRMIRKRARLTLQGLKRIVETQDSSIPPSRRPAGVCE